MASGGGGEEKERDYGFSELTYIVPCYQTSRQDVGGQAAIVLFG